jgi:hypothetical protein
MTGPGSEFMSTCPMAKACKGMASGGPMSGIALVIPALLLIGMGVLIVVEPRVLAWIIAAFFVLMGIGMLFMANFIRRIGANRPAGRF